MKTILLIITFMVVSCGMEPAPRRPYRPPAPPPTPTDPTDPQPPIPPGPADPWRDEIKALVSEQCALAGCHAGAGFLRSGGSLKASSSLSRIQSGNMPKKSSPNYGLYNDAKKRAFIDFLQ
jgi:hypothetical protein